MILQLISLLHRGSFSGETARKWEKREKTGKAKNQGPAGTLAYWKDERDLCGGDEQLITIFNLHWKFQTNNGNCL